MLSSLPVFRNKHILSVLDIIKPGICLKIYENFYTDRKTLYKDFKGDTNSYIYLIVSKLNGKIYVGSSRSIKISNYFNLSHLASQKGRPISSAMLKYGLVNFAFLIIEQVDTSLYNLEVRESHWIKYLNPEYNATKDAARNIGARASHTSETKLAISMKRSKGVIYIYNEFKQLLAIAPSVISIAVLLGNKSISISTNRAIKEGSLFGSSWYFTRDPINLDEKPLVEFGSAAYTDLINQMKSQKHMKVIFVFKDEEFLCRYDGVLAAAKALNISHNTIKENIVNNTTYKGYRFSYHRI